MNVNIEIVTVNGKQYAYLTGDRVNKITKHMVLFWGGVRFAYNGGVIYRSAAPWGDLSAHYQTLVSNTVSMIEASLKAA